MSLKIAYSFGTFIKFQSIFTGELCQLIFLLEVMANLYLPLRKKHMRNFEKDGFLVKGMYYEKYRKNIRGRYKKIS